MSRADLLKATDMTASELRFACEAYQQLALFPTFTKAWCVSSGGMSKPSSQATAVILQTQKDAVCQKSKRSTRLFELHAIDNVVSEATPVQWPHVIPEQVLATDFSASGRLTARAVEYPMKQSTPKNPLLSQFGSQQTSATGSSAVSRQTG